MRRSPIFFKRILYLNIFFLIHSCVTVNNATNGTITINTNAVVMDAFKTYDVNVGCPTGQQLIGGGYNLPGEFNPNKYYVTANYPSSPNTWTVEVVNYSPTNTGADPAEGSIGVYAYCYTGTTNLGMSVQQATNQSPLTVHNVTTNYIGAPRGSVVTSGGYKLNIQHANVLTEGKILGEYPAVDQSTGLANGWGTFTLWEGDQTESVNTYVMYSAANPSVLQANSVLAVTGSLQGQTSIDTLTTSVITGTGYFSTGGGYQFIVNTDQVNGPLQWYLPRAVFMSQALVNNTLFAGWGVQAYMYNGTGNTIPIQVYSVQVKTP